MKFILNPKETFPNVEKIKVCGFFFQMLGSRISDMLDQELSQQQQQGGGSSTFFVIDETKQKQLLQEDEEEDFMDEGRSSPCSDPEVGIRKINAA